MAIKISSQSIYALVHFQSHALIYILHGWIFWTIAQIIALILVDFILVVGEVLCHNVNNLHLELLLADCSQNHAPWNPPK